MFKLWGNCQSCVVWLLKRYQTGPQDIQVLVYSHPLKLFGDRFSQTNQQTQGCCLGDNRKSVMYVFSLKKGKITV